MCIRDRDYCVQYQESDLDFVSRLWEEDGIFYFFEHQRDQDKLVLGDGGHAFPKLPVYAEAQLRDKPHLHEAVSYTHLDVYKRQRFNDTFA